MKNIDTMIKSNKFSRKATSAALFFTLLFLSFGWQSAQAQCNTAIVNLAGKEVKIDTACIGAIVSFKANALGYTSTYTWDFGDGTTNTQNVDPKKVYNTAGLYKVKFTGTGPVGNCSGEVDVYVTPSPKLDVTHLNPRVQCFVGNSFCVRDNSTAAPGSTVDSIVHVWATGQRYVLFPPLPADYCHSHISEAGGKVDLTVQVYDKNGCTTKETLKEFIDIAPKISPEFKSNKPVGCDSVTAVIENVSKININAVRSFTWDFKDATRPLDKVPGPIIKGSPTENLEWWTGDANGIIKYTYYTPGTFNATLTVRDTFNCQESFEFKATATNFQLQLEIIAPDTICADENPVNFSVVPALPGGSRFTWNFGDPPDPSNIERQNLERSKSYGPGPWMASLNVIAGPCNVMFFDTIVVLGPGSQIEVPFDRVAERETYQCVITDTIRFPNNSTYFFNDPKKDDEASVDTQYSATVSVYFDKNTGFDSLQIAYYSSGKLDSFKRFSLNDQITFNGKTFSYDASKDSLMVDTGKIFAAPRRGYGFDRKEVFIFRYPGDQTAVPFPGNAIKGYHPHVWRVWDFADQYAPQCTTDSRPWINKNIGINCNWSIDTTPQHWYTPWEELYKYYNNGQFYSQPYRKIQKNLRDTACYFVNVYPSANMNIPGDTILVVPKGMRDTVYNGVPVYVKDNYVNGWLTDCGWRIHKVPDIIYGSEIKFLKDTIYGCRVDYIKAANPARDSMEIKFYSKNGKTIDSTKRYAWNQTFNLKGATIKYSNTTKEFIKIIGVDTSYYPQAKGIGFDLDTLEGVRMRVVIGNDTMVYDKTHRFLVPPKGGAYYTFEYDTDIEIQDGDVITTFQLDAPTAFYAKDNVRVLTGPGIFRIKPQEQIYIRPGSFVKPQYTIIEKPAQVITPIPSQYLEEIVIGGQIIYTEASKVFVDAEGHRENFYTNTASCYNVELWQKDTVIAQKCTSTAQKALALMPPNARGMTITPFNKNQCALVDNPNQRVQFTIAQTKPGCTQRWFAVNFDSLLTPNSWFSHNGTTPPSFDTIRRQGLPDSVAIRINTDSIWIRGALQTPPKNNPMPFMPYMLAGNYGTQFVRGYTPGVIGNNPNLRKPNGTFTTGLVIGNGALYNEKFKVTNECGAVIKSRRFQDQDSMATVEAVAQCRDIHWYTDFFRILYMNSIFDMKSPGKICAGDTAMYVLQENRQDSTSQIRWNLGYQGEGNAGKNYFATYDELFFRYQKYRGPSPTRNDANIAYNGEDWLYNYIVRSTTDDVRGYKIIDTVVTAIFYEYERGVDKTNPLIREVLERAFQRIGLFYDEIPAEDFKYYLHDGSKTCGIDTSGLSQLFKYGVKVGSHVTDPTNYVLRGDTRYRYIKRITSTGTINADSVPVAKILHFRDSSLQGYDSMLITAKNIAGQDSIYMQRGVWKFPYEHYKKITPDPCKPDSFFYQKVKSTGPMAPSLFLANTTGCNNRFGTSVLVGYLNEYYIRDQKINYCIGQDVFIKDSIRYWNADGNDPSWPIIPTPYWRTRYLAGNKEKFFVDWDDKDGFQPERGLDLNHSYTKAGKYFITIASEDTAGCTDTVKVAVFVTDVKARIQVDSLFSGCNTIIGFVDSSIVFDPCNEESCGDTDCDRLVQWRWNFGDSTRLGEEQNSSHNYTRGGFYTVQLAVLSQLGCEDTAYANIGVPGPIPEFEFTKGIYQDWDSAVICVGDSIQLLNTSGGTKIDPSWIMEWGDGDLSNPKDSGTLYSHIYNKVGTFFLKLIQSDSIPGLNAQNCNRVFPDENPDLLRQRRIKVIVLDSVYSDFTIDDTLVCRNQIVKFKSTSDDIITRFSWDFGDGDTIMRSMPEDSATHSYRDIGRYVVTLDGIFDTLPFVPSCRKPMSKIVEVEEVIADFDIDSSGMPNFCFKNTSIGGVRYEWSMQNVNAASGDTFYHTSVDESPCYNWEENQGTFQVCLVAFSSQDCPDTICKPITNTFRKLLIPYNVFTPGSGDVENDVYLVDAEGLVDFDLKIYNRWGELVFESTDKTVGWNGKVKNTGIDCPAGTYYYILNYQFEREEKNGGKKPIEGSITLIRK